MSRVFATLEEAIPEVRRDLSKAPHYNSERVQNQARHQVMQEAQCYSVTILSGGIPRNADQLLNVIKQHFEEYGEEDYDDVYLWLLEERKARVDPIGYSAFHAITPDNIHPKLRSLNEGNHYSYTYRERLQSGINSVVEALAKDRHSRRAFIPIYQPVDLVRASEYTRIPCTLGYSFLIREVGDIPYLHCTYISRSTDFEKFWASDLWMASQLQHVVTDMLAFQIPTLRCGALTHFAISLHRFVPEDEELF